MWTAAAFVASAAIGALLPAVWILAPGAAGSTRVPWPPGDWYEDFKAGGGVDALSHAVLYYDVGRSIENAARADVLFVGSSQTGFALPREVLGPFFQARGLRYFNLAFGHGERVDFAAAVIDRHGLAPRLVVAEAAGFFKPGLSAEARAILSQSDWETRRSSIETHVYYAYQRTAARLFPHLLPKLFDTGSEPPWGWFELLRSADHGSWDVRRFRDARIPVQPRPDRKLPDKLLRRAYAFRRLVEARGGRLVLVYPPGSILTRSRADAARVAAYLEVPLLPATLEGLTLGDGLHLSPDSGRRFATALLHELDARGLLGEPLR